MQLSYAALAESKPTTDLGDSWLEMLAELEAEKLADEFKSKAIKRAGWFFVIVALAALVAS